MSKKKPSKKKLASRLGEPSRPARKKKRAPAPTQARLTGMEDTKIEHLEKLAMRYAEIRDERMELNREEHDLKKKILRGMHAAGKVIYKHAGVVITVQEAEEDVTVRVKKPKSGKAAEAEAKAEEQADDEGDVIDAEPGTDDPQV